VKSPAAIERIYADNTELMAQQLLQNDIGNWIAVTATAIDISRFDGRCSNDIEVRAGVELYSTAKMCFDPAKWSRKLGQIQKGARIYAVCQLGGGDSDSIMLNECELALPEHR
jgi:hypothetical protein